MEYSIKNIKQKYRKYFSLHHADPSNDIYKHKVDKYNHYLTQMGGSGKDSDDEIVTDYDEDFDDEVIDVNSVDKKESSLADGSEQDFKVGINNIMIEAKNIIVEEQKLREDMLQKINLCNQDLKRIQEAWEEAKSTEKQLNERLVNLAQHRDTGNVHINNLKKQRAEDEEKINYLRTKLSELMNIIKNLAPAEYKKTYFPE